MRYAASEKLEIIRTVERSFLGVRRTLAQIGIPRSTFYNWYGRYVVDGLEDRKPSPGAVWNKVPEAVAEELVTLALAAPDLSTVMDDFSRYIVSWRLCKTMSAAEGVRRPTGCSAQ